jgi:MoaA/NifB/PqqE/SkfB family radical SAM enzyme
MRKLIVKAASISKQKVKKVGMYINELVIEITRRCNLACQHCLRGEPQNVDISNETIDKLLGSITDIGMITFTGGEPTLAVDKIRYIYEQIKKRGIYLNGFYVVTNGKIASRELMNALIDLFVLIGCPDQEDCIASLVISKDQYHEQERYDDERKAADKLYSDLSFYRPKDRDRDLKMLINEGRARGMGQREAYLESFVVETGEDDEPTRVEGTVYINAIGDVITSCNMSYESQEENKIGNVNEKSLSEIVAKAVA